MNKYKNVSILFKLVQKLSAILVRPLANDNTSRDFIGWKFDTADLSKLLACKNLNVILLPIYRSLKEAKLCYAK